jgi:nucleotide-binding universal stress UspA family protein
MRWIAVRTDTMFKCEKILFPIAFSRHDEATAPFVLSMARRYQAQVVLLHAIQPAPPVYAGMGGIYPEVFDFEGLREDLLIEVRKFAAAQLPKVDVECIVEIGDPAYTISQYACGADVDLVAMPTHGYGAFRRALLGSVTAKVLHDSARPVWTDAHAPEPSHRAHPQPRHIICAVDLKPESQHVIEAAVALANDAGATLELVNVPAETACTAVAEHYMQHLLKGVPEAAQLSIQVAAPLALPAKGDGGSVADGIRDLALRKRADLVVIGRGAIQKGFGRLHSHAYDIIRDCPCPVLSV